MNDNVNRMDHGYRRGAIMGLTVAEAFILISFLLLLLFAFWQWDIQKEKTNDLRANQDAEQLREQIRHLEELAVDREALLAERSRQLTQSDRDADAFREQIQHLEDLAVDREADLAEQARQLAQAGQDADMLMEQIRELEELTVDREALLAERSRQLAQSDRDADAFREQIQHLEDLAVDREADLAEQARQLAQAGQDADMLMEQIRELEGLTATLEDTVAEQALEVKTGIAEKIQSAEARERALASALETKLGGLVARIGGRIDTSGAIVLPDSVLFERGEAHITRQLHGFLAEACNPWLTVLKNSDVPISEIKIEGHASSEWRADPSLRGAYLGNLDLSQRRSQAVLRTCLDFVSDPEMLEWARKHLIAVGYSSVRPVIRNGKEDRTASRRVVFSVTPSRDALIQDIEEQIR